MRMTMYIKLMFLFVIALLLSSCYYTGDSNYLRNSQSANPLDNIIYPTGLDDGSYMKLDSNNDLLDDIYYPTGLGDGSYMKFDVNGNSSDSQIYYPTGLGDGSYIPLNLD